MVISSSLRLAACASVLLLSACSSDGVSRTFGFTRSVPDEFTVTTRAPLTMPPDYNLRAPQPGAARPQEMSTAQGAEATLSPTAVAAPQSAGDSTGQQALLQAAGPRAAGDIRNQIAADAAGGAQDRSLTDRLTSWAKPTPAGPPVVDPVKEADRLRTNAALGQSPDTGDTPVIKPKRPGLLDWLF